jgi:hypothetical protein
MMAQSLDSVLADVDASDQEIANDTPVVENVQADQPEQDQPDEDQGPDAIGALTAERHRVKRKYTETVADFEKRLNETNSSFEKKLTESLSENDKKWEQRFNQFAQNFQQPRQQPEPEKVVERPDMFENPDGFVEHGVRSAVDPVKAEVGQLREFYSRREAIRDHGQEKVQAAFSALDQAAKAGDPEARAVCAKVKESMDPFGDIVQWHQRSTVISEVGNDPAAYRQRILDEALKDQAFLNKALEQARGVATPVVNGPKPAALPSLNRVAAASDDGDEEEDAGAVFRSAQRGGARR